MFAVITLFLSSILIPPGPRFKPGEDPIRAAFETCRHPVEWKDGRLSGPGLDLLLETARESRYVLVGEDHGVAEILELSTDLYSRLRPMGFDHYVTEVGPVSGRKLASLAADTRGLDAFREFYGDHPWSIPFAWFTEEVALLREVARDGTILGIDQEFVLSPGFHFHSLARRLEETPMARAFQTLAEEERKAFRKMIETRNPQTPGFFMNSPPGKTWEEVEKGIEATGSDVERETLEALLRSRAVYQEFFQGNFHRNNQTRAALMEEYFFSRLEDLPESSRFFVKLGGNHVVRGTSPVGILDIGHEISQHCRREGTRSVHVGIIPLTGQRNAYLPFLPETMKSARIDPRTYRFYRPLIENLPTDKGWNLYDLRPLRENPPEGADRAFEDLVGGFDFLLALDVVRPATLVE